MKKGTTLTKTAENKQAVLTLASTGQERPRTGTYLANFIHNYALRLKSPTFDQDFRNALMEVRPDWFCGKERAKKILLEAANGVPTDKAKLRQSRNYLKATGRTDVIKEAKTINPTLFVTPDEKKAKLLAMAKAGEKRPSSLSKIGRSFRHYVFKSKYGASYDEDFRKEIESVRPDWLLPVTERTRLKKDAYIAMATAGEECPKDSEIYRYGYKSSPTYDADFRAKIDAVNPKWYDGVPN